MLKNLCFLLILFSFIKCGNISNKKEELKINLAITNSKNKCIGLIVVENQLKKSVTINYFTSSVAPLSLEIQNSKGSTFGGLGSPPMPPDNIESYNITLKHGEQIKIPLDNIKFLVELPSKGVRIRCKILYKINDKNAFQIGYSQWVLLNEIK